jgi:hypothetical protein
LVLRLLHLPADGYRRVAVPTRLDILESQRGGDEVAKAVTVEPLLLIQHEPERAHQPEAVGRQGVESGHVAACLGLRPALVQFPDFFLGLVLLGHGLSPSRWPGDCFP